ncbi:MAG: hypothetical protein M0T74_10355 [Desulfitobacterium hafniense]|nr:hypothetical protein [Desulfitobacterium hafniense]
MKKHIITGILIVACAVLGSVVWPRSAEDGKIPAELVKPAVIAETEANPEETLPIFLSDDTYVPEPKGAIESKPAETEVNTTEDKIRTTPAIPTKSEVSTNPSSAPKAGTLSVINGERYIWVPSFGWVKDEGGGSIAIPVDGEGDINKQVGVMGGGTTVGNPGDELTGHKVGSMGGDDASSSNNEPAPGTQKYIDGKLHVWVPGFGWVESSGEPSVGTTAEGMYENGNKIGSMGGEEPQDSNTSSPPTEQPESTGDEIHIVFVETPEKNSTPPPYKPDTKSP